MVRNGVSGQAVLFLYTAKGMQTGQTCLIRVVDTSDGSKKVNDLSMTEVSSSNAPGLYSYTYTPASSGNYAVYMFQGSLASPTWLQTDELVVSSGLPTIAPSSAYTTPALISSFLGLRATDGTRFVFGSGTIPTDTEIYQLVYNVMDQIDQFTAHAWRAITVTDEVYNYRPPRDIGYGGRYRESRGICLNHRSIKTFSHASGDKLEVYNGASWIDFLTTYTEGRGSDFWVDYGKGIIYFTNQYPLIADHPCRVTYRFGEALVPYDIQRAATMLAACDLLMGDEGNNLTFTPEGGTTSRERCEEWRKEAWKILEARREVI
jgi:hypothetical protein